METTTWMFFIFNVLVALWVIAHPLFLSGKEAALGKRATLVVVGITYGVIVITAIMQVQNTGVGVSSYL